MYVYILAYRFIYCWFTLVQYYFYRATNNCKKSNIFYSLLLLYRMDGNVCIHLNLDN